MIDWQGRGRRKKLDEREEGVRLVQRIQNTRGAGVRAKERQREEGREGGRREGNRGRA